MFYGGGAGAVRLNNDLSLGSGSVGGCGGDLAILGGLDHFLRAVRLLGGFRDSTVGAGHSGCGGTVRVCCDLSFVAGATGGPAAGGGRDQLTTDLRIEELVGRDQEVIDLRKIFLFYGKAVGAILLLLAGSKYIFKLIPKVHKGDGLSGNGEAHRTGSDASVFCGTAVKLDNIIHLEGRSIAGKQVEGKGVPLNGLGRVTAGTKILDHGGNILCTGERCFLGQSHLEGDGVAINGDVLGL